MTIKSLSNNIDYNNSILNNIKSDLDKKIKEEELKVNKYKRIHEKMNINNIVISNT